MVTAIKQPEGPSGILPIRPVKQRQEEEQPKTAMIQPMEMPRPDLSNFRQSMADRLEGVERIIKTDPTKAVKELDSAISDLKSVAPQVPLNPAAEKLQKDDLKHVDALHSVARGSILMAESTALVAAQHAENLERGAHTVRQLTELKGLMQKHSDREQLDLEKEEGVDFARMKELIPLARKHGVIWPEESKGWTSEKERGNLTAGVDSAIRDLSKQNEITQLRHQQTAQTYFGHVSSAVSALSLLAKIIAQIIQRINGH